METLPREHLVARQHFLEPLGGRTDLCSPPLGLHNTKQSRMSLNTGMRDDKSGSACCFTQSNSFSSARGWQIRKGQIIDKPVILEAMIRLIEALCVWQYGRKGGVGHFCQTYLYC